VRERDCDGPLDVVGEDVEAHFRSDVSQPPHSEVISSHPLLKSTEDMLDDAASDPHRVRLLVQPAQHFLQHGVMRRCLLGVHRALMAQLPQLLDQ
jgi:hypothetical protein